MRMKIILDPIRECESAWCEETLRALPGWFGIEESLLEYVRDTAALPTWIARRSGQPVGFITIRIHNPHAAEIHCMAVRPEAHRRGVGRAMVRFVEEHVRRQGARLLQVKTLGPSRPDEHYERTRRFYEAMGFVPLEEMKTLWPGNPCQVFVMPLDCLPAD